MRNIFRLFPFLGAILFFPGLSSMGQVIISYDESSPHSSAMLEVKSDDKGFLPPRVALSDITVADPISSPATGLVIFNTATAGTAPDNVVPGYYYWNGTIWALLSPPRGTSPGDMLYWDGVHWTEVEAGSPGQFLQLSLSGVPEWSGDAYAALTTATVSSILTTTAVSGGTISSDGGTEVTARGVCWSTSSNPVSTGNHTTDGSGTGTFTSNLTGLEENTSYYVRSYGTNSVGTAYGNEISFITLAPTLAAITTTIASSITITSATSGGTITSDGGAEVTARGVCWNTSANPTIADNFTTNGTGTGQFISSITGLAGGTTYYVRAYATNSVGIAYGDEITFITMPATLATLTTTTVSSIKSTGATSGGSITNDGGAEVTARGICWNTSANPTISDNSTTDGSGTGIFTSAITGLILGTTYYARAYATNGVGTSYGNEVSFTTALGIGDQYQGGIIAYFFQPGENGYVSGQTHGLIAAPNDQSASAEWGCYETTISGADGIDIGDGYQNTIDIMAGCSTAGIAARICGDLTLNGFDDWFLPSRYELNRLYANRASIGNFAGGGYYWSSTEQTSTGAVLQVFSNLGSVYNGDKNYTARVRAVRTF